MDRQNILNIKVIKVDKSKKEFLSKRFEFKLEKKRFNHERIIKLYFFFVEIIYHCFFCPEN